MNDGSTALEYWMVDHLNGMVVPSMLYPPAYGTAQQDVSTKFDSS